MKDVREKIAKTQQKLHEDLTKLGFVESATLIGKPVTERRIERINDLDNVIIVNGPMTDKKLNAIKRLFENLRNETKNNVDVQYAIADGPMKPPSDKEHEIFYHVILHTSETYKKSPLLLVENSWQYEKPYLGSHGCCGVLWCCSRRSQSSQLCTG